MQRKIDIKRTENKAMIFPTVIAATIAVAAFLLVACLLCADLFFVREEMAVIDVPSYVGSDEMSIHGTDSIEIEKIYTFSDTEEEGIVISQSFSGKTKVAPNDRYRLKLTVSLGEEKREMPDLFGRDIYEASAILRKMGCVVKTILLESEHEADSVIMTVPEKSTELHRGETVTLYIATKSTPKVVCVPDFYGCDADSLRKRVEMSGLNLGKIELIYSEDFLPDRVIYQSTRAGCLVPYGETVDFYVASKD